MFVHYLEWETPQSSQRAHSACSKNPSMGVDTISIGYSTLNRRKSEAKQTMSMKKNRKKKQQREREVIQTRGALSQVTLHLKVGMHVAKCS